MAHQVALYVLFTELTKKFFTLEERILLHRLGQFRVDTEESYVGVTFFL
jgi:hypothetical protein